METAANTRSGWTRLAAVSGTFGLLLVALGGILVAGIYLGGRVVTSAVCSSYNFISNDFCDEWSLEPAPSGAVPLPPGWTIELQQLSCGSGGCGYRLYVLTPEAGALGGTRSYLSEIKRMGWTMQGSREARRGQLYLMAEPTTTRFAMSILPRRLEGRGHVLVSLAICGEGAVCA